MIPVYKNPPRGDWPTLFTRPTVAQQDLSGTVAEIMQRIKTEGDAAVKAYTERFDKVALTTLDVSEDELQEAESILSDELKAAIQLAKNNIEKFHSAQLQTKQEIETMPGVTCWREQRGIEKVGIYIPGGTAPLFSTVLMLGIPAKLAGCREIVLCSPPNQEGKLHPAILYAAQLVGVTKLFKTGGVQAICALTFGTESIPQVYKIFGPGNQYVTEAKQQAQKFGVAIDMPAGPSEVLVIADETANPAYVASDLLSQAEHGADSQVILLSTSETLIEETNKQVELQLEQLPRKQFAAEALKASKAILLESIEDCFTASNVYAPEHLILAIDKPTDYINRIVNAGSVFLGNLSCESLGDYASGTNHTLPTNGYARNYSGVSVDSFVRKITFQQVSEQGLRNIGPAVEQMAAAEQLLAHKNAVSIRLSDLKD